MDFDDAIQAHTNWKLQLLDYARGKTARKINLQTLQKGDICTLGQWLRCEGEKYSGDPKFTKLLATHSAFHTCAASIGALVDRGQTASAEVQWQPLSCSTLEEANVLGILECLTPEA